MPVPGDAPSDDRSPLRRREFLLGGAAAGLAASAPINYAALARSRRLPLAREGRFAHGIACGYPGRHGAILWTRVSELERSSRLTLEVATDARFRHVIREKPVAALERRDFTAHARVGGLEPGREYYYRFHTAERDSPVGRIRTAPPPGSKEPIRIGFFSCQAHEAGYYTAHTGLATEPDLDLVVCLGDYVYETVFYEGPEERRDRTGRNRDGDVQTLAEFRQKYRLYQRDRNLQAMHAAHPFTVMWDDHEVEENYAGDQTSPKNDDPDSKTTDVNKPRRVPFLQRRRNGYRAFFEALPIRRIRGDGNRIYRALRVGQAEVILLDQRQYKDPQPCGDMTVTPCPEARQSFRTMLGERQKAWLKERLRSSDANWKLLGSQMMFMGFDSAPGLTLNVDAWDGYAQEREDILRFALDRGVENIVSLAGDIHTFFAGRVTTTGNVSGQTAGTEFVGGSISSHGLREDYNVPQEGAALANVIRTNNPHIDYVDAVHRGYGVLTAKSDELLVDFKAVRSALTPHSETFTLARFRVPSGTPTVQQLG